MQHLLVLLAALTTWALASPAALAASCGHGEEQEAAVPAQEPASSGVTLSGVAPGECCPAEAACGVCCLAPTPHAPEHALIGALGAAVLLAGIVLPTPREELAPVRPGGADPPCGPTLSPSAGPRGPPAC